MMQKLMNRRNRKGFTLIELIVVIAIIAILAAIAIPRFAGFTDSAKKKSDVANATMIANAIQVAIADNKLVPVNDATSGVLTSVTDAAATAAISATAADISAALTAVLVPAYMESIPIPKYDNTGTTPAKFQIAVVTGKITINGKTSTDVAYPVPAGNYAK